MTWGGGGNGHLRFTNTSYFESLTKYKILNSTKLKVFADDKLILSLIC